MSRIPQVAAAGNSEIWRIKGLRRARMEALTVQTAIQVIFLALAEQKAEDGAPLVEGMEQADRFTDPAEEGDRTIFPRLERKPLATAAPATRESSMSASRWTRAFITDEEGSICDLQ